MARQIKRQILKLSESMKKRVQGYVFPMREMSHIVGQAAAIRFFDEDSRNDFEAINEILTAKQVKIWVDDAGKISWADYRYWSGKHTRQSFLFSVHDSRFEKQSQIKKVRGFVNLYSERGEKFRVKRMVKAGIIKKSVKNVLEVSLALRPSRVGSISGSGLMSSALRQSCLQVKSWLDNPKGADLAIFGFVDQVNTASVRVFKAAGFVRKGKMKYDSTSGEESLVYVLNWQRMQKKVRDSMDKTLRNKMKVVLEPQVTDSHCGPAVVKALLKFNGIDVSQDQIVTAAKVKSKIINYGMRPAQIALAVKNLAPGLRFWFKQGATINDLEKLTHIYNVPVGINWQGLFYDTVAEEKLKSTTKDRGHYSVVIDINSKKDQIVIDDPFSEYFEVPRVFSYRWFKGRWWDNDELYNRKFHIKNILITRKLIFIIVPGNTEFPPDLGLKDMSALVEMERNEKCRYEVI